MEHRDAPWENRFFFDLFKRGYVSPFYRLPIRNRLTKDVLFYGVQEHGAEKDDVSVPRKAVATSREPVATIQDTVSVIWDIPAYLEVPLKDLGPYINMVKVRQYKGFLIDLTPFKDLNGYLGKQLSGRSRKKLRSKKRNLEKGHRIRYAFYYGAIKKKEYDRLFTKFHTFLKERFEEKQAVNNSLGKWDYYRTLVYPMILEKRASLFVIYDGDTPITIGMQFHLSRTVFSFVQSYDIAYSQYNMGDISTMKRLEWCYEQGFDMLDLSMGETDYKLKWCNHHYDLYFHVFHNPKSASSVLISRIIILKLRFKQYLRDKHILGKMFRFDKFKYRLRNLFP